MHKPDPLPRTREEFMVWYLQHHDWHRRSTIAEESWGTWYKNETVCYQLQCTREHIMHMSFREHEAVDSVLTTVNHAIKSWLAHTQQHFPDLVESEHTGCVEHTRFMGITVYSSIVL